MATRFYLPSTGGAAVSPAYDAAWEDTTGVPATRLKCVVAREESLMDSLAFFSASGDTDDKDILFRQYVSDPMEAQTLTAQTLKFQLQATEGALFHNGYTDIGIRVVSNDGSTVRGTVLAVTRDDLEVYVPGWQNRQFVATTTQVVAQSGDRIVIEVGVGGQPTSPGGRLYAIVVGDDSSTDLPEDDSELSSYNPWVEFTQDLAFTGPQTYSRTLLETLTPVAIMAPYRTSIRTLTDLLDVSEVLNRSRFLSLSDGLDLLDSYSGDALDFQVLAASDDIRHKSDHTVQQDGLTFGIAGGVEYSGGLRFRDVQIPHQARILSAYITHTARNTRANQQIDQDIYGADHDDAATFTGYDADFHRTLTSAKADWLGTESWTLGEEYDSPDISAIIQEIVDRPGWQPGNAIMLFSLDSGNAPNDHRHAAYQYDDDPAKVSKLHIEYDQGGGLTRIITRVLVLLDTLDVTVAHLGYPRFQQPEDLINLIEMFSIGRLQSTTLADTLTLSDSMLSSVGHLLTDLLTISDTIVKGTSAGKAEVLSLSEVITKGTYEGLTDSITLADVVAKDSHKFLSDVLTLLGALQKAITAILPTETVTLTDAVVAQHKTLNLSDTLTLADTITKAAAHFLADVLSLQDVLLGLPRPVLELQIRLRGHLTIQQSFRPHHTIRTQFRGGGEE